MLKFLKEIITNDSTGSGESEKSIDRPVNESQKVEIATCALMMEVANSDDEFTDEEKDEIIALMKNTFNLDDEYVVQLLELSEQQISKSVSLYEFTNVINDNFSPEQKYMVVKNLWRVILIDEKINKYEEHFIRKISNNLHLDHKDLIAAKMEVKEEMNIK